jgi:hypothetical protein
MNFAAPLSYYFWIPLSWEAEGNRMVQLKRIRNMRAVGGCFFCRFCVIVLSRLLRLRLLNYLRAMSFW